MPTAVLQPGPDRREVMRSRPNPTVDISPPSVDLLPSDGEPIPGTAPAPHRALALASTRILRYLRDHPCDAGFWGEATFAREVDAVRRQLAPIASRRGLASSYLREAFRVHADAGVRGPAGFRPADVAYAIRWLELGDGVARPRWTASSAAPG